jgi:hypothetical protein
MLRRVPHRDRVAARARGIVGRSLAAAFLVAAALAPGALASSAGSSISNAIAPAIDPKCATYPCYTLTFDLSGNGSGHVYTTAAPGGSPDGLIDCRFLNGVLTTGSICSHEYVDILRTGSVDVYWYTTADAGSDTCAGSRCDVTLGFHLGLTYDRAIAVEFRLQTRTLTVTHGGTGTGIVQSDPAGILCGTTATQCATTANYGTTYRLNAYPSFDSTFGGWTGACAGQGSECLIALIGNLTTEAIFVSPSATSSAAPTLPASPKPTTVATAAAGATPATDPTSGPGISLAATSGPTSEASEALDSMAATVLPSARVLDPAASSAGEGPLVLLLVAGLVAAGAAFAAYRFTRSRS